MEAGKDRERDEGRETGLTEKNWLLFLRRVNGITDYIHSFFP